MSTFAIPFDFSPVDGVRARIPNYIGDDDNQMLRLFDQMLVDLESGEGDLKPDQVDFISPLILHGPSFTAKSCLALAFAQRLAKIYSFSPSEIRFVKLADFCSDLQKSFQTKTTNDFREQFHAAKVVVFDDLHRLENQRLASTEFQLMLDRFASNQQFIILTSASKPNLISGLCPRLASRLTCGMELPVAQLGRESALSILSLFGLDDDVQLDVGQTISFDEICQKANSKTIGDSGKVTNDSHLDGLDLSMAIDKLIDRVSSELGVPKLEILSGSRKKTVFVRSRNLYLPHQDQVEIELPGDRKDLSTRPFDDHSRDQKDSQVD